MQPPNMCQSVMMFAIKLKISNNVQDVVDHKPVFIPTTRVIKATVKVAKPEDLQVADVDLSLKYLLVLTLPPTELKIDDNCEHRGTKYKCIQASEYTDYGYLKSIFEQVKTGGV